MNNPIRQHYIPRVILRQFVNSEGYLYFHRRDFARGEIRMTSPENLFVKRNINTMVHSDSSNDYSVELFFSRVESITADFFAQLLPAVRSGAPIKMNDNAWHCWTMFYYYQLKRHPKAFEDLIDDEGVGQPLDFAIAEFEARTRPLTPKERAELADPATSHQLMRNVIAQARRQMPSPELLEAFSEVGLLAVKIPNERKSFIIGDRPFVKVSGQEINPNRAGTLTMLPVSHDVAISPCGSERKVLVEEIADERQVRLINERMFAQSETVAGRSARLISSLSRHVKAAVVAADLTAL